MDVPVSAVESASDTRLRDLAQVIQREHALAMDAATQVVVHAIACGEALIEAKTLVPAGEWGAWIERNIPHGRRASMCRNYMRIAFLKEHADPSLSITSNILMLRGLPGRSSATPRIPAETKDEALPLHAAGFGRAEIARRCDTTIETVRAWTEPGYVERRTTQQRAARHRQRIADGRVAALPAPSVDRAFRHGEPGRAAVGRAVRHLAGVQGKAAVVEALLDLAAIAERWAERIAGPSAVTREAA